ncbi:uncharacterized protein Z518_09607 [Rhinocladiella mackenziei CBS 650.93]|uniref:Uncharacterized protein n=1 Tax=Rhinocladiella mackenziei CBS 650.93 TaxID=1442369 RepID=A0A0D2FEW5_9EURO|nr:uncharacterized protein Z518_09607 [Rhinocladiella mackenziei CBS 650.93]KIX00542.1 hypothetical protein Z518_09607 [Rhinocladiella mackenziei CBS 650.93]
MGFLGFARLLARDNVLAPERDAANPTEVKWQVVWWALVPLALGAMIQPCGRVLGQEHKSFRFYARMSPFICIADTAHFLVAIIRATCSSAPRYDIERLFVIRFKDEDRDTKSVETSILLRLALLFVSGIPCQTIKLVGMQGIPWTKAIALMFFISIVFGEAIIFIAHHLDLPILVPPSSTYNSFDYEPRRRRGNPLRPILGPVTYIFRLGQVPTANGHWLVSFALGIQTATNTSTICGLISRAREGNRLIILLQASWAFSAILITSGLFLKIFPGAKKYYLEMFFFQVKAWCLLMLISGLFATTTNPLLDRMYRGWIYNGDIWLLTVGCVVVVAFAHILNSLLPAVIIPFWIDDSHIKALFRIGTIRQCQVAVMCIFTLPISILGYCFLYDPAGTVNPGWTGVFG